ncbi:protein SUPPRESSOR OF QUENCHING 1, chloroplastic-like isoform X2 [Salvia splendens]|uniref:protein SUPPRESSOR OF QUENCHING 1, chloroplastic-like isoform X2 n=1 Tax=Salvia splendens TaxID=180675 RepID=UPI001C26F47C|nr:protein SUPPRESSOR OF QUENCHING 1, chloroplastic-like isoform X2 [Salvia splendens]
MGTGESKFLGGVASVKGVEGFNPESAKKRFFEIYLDKYAKPNSGIGFPGAYELVVQIYLQRKHFNAHFHKFYLLLNVTATE